MVRFLLASLGVLSLFLAVVGALLPLLPATPFLLLAVFFFARSSERLHRWLVEHRHLGPYLAIWREGRAIPIRAKVAAVLLITITTGTSAVFFLPWPEARLAVLLAGVAASAWILTRK